MNEFQKIIANLIILFREMTALQNIKLRAARDKHIAVIEECMTKEQAMILRLKGLDKERQEKQEALGFGGMKFQEILKHLEGTQREELLLLFDELSREIQMYQEVSEDVACIIKVNLRQLHKGLEGQGDKLYMNGGKEEDKGSHLMSRSI